MAATYLALAELGKAYFYRHRRLPDARGSLERKEQPPHRKREGEICLSSAAPFRERELAARRGRTHARLALVAGGARPG